MLDLVLGLINDPIIEVNTSINSSLSLLLLKCSISILCLSFVYTLYNTNIHLNVT